MLLLVCRQSANILSKTTPTQRVATRQAELEASHNVATGSCFQNAVFGSTLQRHQAKLKFARLQ